MAYNAENGYGGGRNSTDSVGGYGSASDARSVGERSTASSRSMSRSSLHGDRHSHQSQQQQEQQQYEGDFDNVELHELAKGWKAAIARATDPNTRHEAQIKNDRGNLPLHSAASFRSPLEVTEALLEAYPEAASLTNNYGNLALHFTAWKKGPLDVERLLLKIFPKGAAQKNNHGNLPLHYAAHYNAPLEVVEALYNAYPEGAYQKNNDSNTPLDLAIADGASPNVVALLQGRSVPPTDEEQMSQSKNRCEQMEKELQLHLNQHDTVQEDLDDVLTLLMEIRESHGHSLFSAGVDVEQVSDLDSLLREVRRAARDDDGKSSSNDEEGRYMDDEMAGPNNTSMSNSGNNGRLNNSFGGGQLNPNLSALDSRLLAVVQHNADNEQDAGQDISTSPEDEVERLLNKIVGLDPIKNQVRGMRRTLELKRRKLWRSTNGGTVIKEKDDDRDLPPHFALVGAPGTGKTDIARLLGRCLYKIGAVKEDKFIEVNRDDLVERTEQRTQEKMQRILARAQGGILFVDEAYTLLPSQARRTRGKHNSDHGAVALKTIANVLQSQDPLVIIAGYPNQLQKVLGSNVVGFKSNFLTLIEFPDPTTREIAKMFLNKAKSKGLVFAQGVTSVQIADLLEENTTPEWRSERNGRISDLLLHSVRSLVKRRNGAEADESTLVGASGGNGSGSGGLSQNSPIKGMPLPGSNNLPVSLPEEVIVTVEDIQKALETDL
eukprot:CAMPEP_0194356456 /NCGR_PEP_ID=MMETSP0174-20130528/4106_1 /TAXON_ID=216777 /ORGANISM="Proboscia alata, Strain PI-D3" /LENGTH=718 /DNA_ID=CAMNT_0039126057 /DNA_START=77 /DNA_END=2233 /DNA_ORIENTATION=+